MFCKHARRCGKGGCSCLAERFGRRGIVDIHGEPMEVIGAEGACYDIGCGDCTCRGDMSTDGVTPGYNGVIDFGDFNYFLGQFGAAAPVFVIDPVPSDLVCADLSTDGVNPGSNGQIDFGDFNYFLTVFGSYAPTFSGPCLP
jgi:hypothetical protein